MYAIETPCGELREEFVAELSDVASVNTLRHGIKGSSVDVELDVWKALSRVVGKDPRPIRVENPGALPWSCDELLAEFTDAAYQVALQHGVKGSFLDVELGLFQALRNVMAEHADSAALVPRRPGGSRHGARGSGQDMYVRRSN
jgi:hypothetical protein